MESYITAISQWAKSPRLKGNARNMQKMAAGPTLERYALVTDEIQPLAKKLVSKDKANVQVPQAVLHLIQKVMEARRWCTTFAYVLLASSRI